MITEKHPPTTHSDAYAKYQTLGKKAFMTLAEAEALSHDLAAEIVAAVGRPDLAVGLANGAVLPTRIVAEDLGIPFQVLRVRRRGSRYKEKAFNVLSALRIPGSLLRVQPLSYLARRLLEVYDDLEHKANGFEFPLRDKHVVLVDDAIYTSRSLRYACDQLTAHAAAKVTTAVLCWYRGQGDSGDWSPDIYLMRQDHYYPWSYCSPHLDDYSAWLAANDLAAFA